MRRSRGWWKQRLINWVALLVTVAMGRVERVVAIAIDEKIDACSTLELSRSSERRNGLRNIVRFRVEVINKMMATGLARAVAT